MENLNIHNKINYLLEKNITWFTKSCSVKDSNENDLLFFKQKKLLFSKINTKVFTNSDKQNSIASIVPINIIDVNHHFILKSEEKGEEFGILEKKFITSKLWRTRYEFSNMDGKLIFYILEENPWVRFSNMLLKRSKRTSLIPKYFFRPSYQVFDKSDNLIGCLKENKGVFKTSRVIEIDNKLQLEKKNSILLALMILSFIE